MNIFKPIEIIADLVTFNVLGLPESSYLAHAVHFFVLDTIKIGLLLIVIGFVMAVFRYYLPAEKVKNILLKKRWYGLDYLMAAILGAVTPFCSCSSIPLFVGFVGAGIPLGITFTFLISSPLINETSLFLFPAIFGLKTSLLYNFVGVLVSIIGGMLIQKINPIKYLDSSLLKFKNRAQVIAENKGVEPPLKKRIKIWWSDAMGITRKIYLYVLIGVAIGAVVHGYVPADFVGRTLGNDRWWSVIVATFIGVPLYANSVSVIPVVQALIGKGIPTGTAFALMTATVTLAIPQILILKKIMRWQLLAIFYGITIVGIIIIGYLFNLLYFIN